MTTLTGFERDRSGIFIRKSPTAVLDYTVDWTDWMPVDDTISTSSFQISTISGDAAPLTSDSDTRTDVTATSVLSGGTAGKVYTVACTITTLVNSLTETREFRVLVENRSV